MEHAATTEKIIGCAFRVYNSLGFGYLESVYENSLLLELQRQGVRVESQQPVPVHYDGSFVGNFVADMLVDNEIIVELKSVRQLAKAHELQLVNYLAATGHEIGLLINFGEHRVEVKRKHRTPKRSAFPSAEESATYAQKHPEHPCDPSHPVHPVKNDDPPQKTRPPKEYDFFLAGVIQGSHEGAHTHSQDYRDEIKAILAKKAPGRKVFCPVENHRHSVKYTDAQAKKVFFGHIEVLRRSRVMIAYLPTASMGTAVEMAVCKEEGIPIITITPMALNWVVRLYSYAVVPDFKAFAKWMTKKNLKKLGI